MLGEEEASCPSTESYLLITAGLLPGPNQDAEHNEPEEKQLTVGR